MPVLRYFVFVGAALLALLFVVDAALPQLPAAPGVASASDDILGIRIHSDRKWPERVVFDTNAPMIVPATTQMANNEAGTTGPVQAAQVADNSAKVTARDAFAQLTRSDVKKPEPKHPQKRRIARRRVAPPPVQVAQRPLFGLFANNIW